MQLHAVVAIHKDAKSRANKEGSALKNLLPKTALFQGFTRAYRPKEDGGEDIPSEAQKVTLTWKEVVRRIVRLETDNLDFEATLGIGNTGARADIIVDGCVIIYSAPTSLLLFLDKELAELRAFIELIPVLDPSKEWAEDPSTGLSRTPATMTIRTKKTEKVVVAIPPTEHQKGEWTKLTEDETVGYWDTVNFSGAIPAPKKEEILDRLEKLSRAVGDARTRANSTEVTKSTIAESIFGYLFE